VQQFEPLRFQVGRKDAHPGDVPAWPANTFNETKSHRIAAKPGNDGNCAARCDNRASGGTAAPGDDHVNLPANQIAGEFR
jgi:hypothetical protein